MTDIRSKIRLCAVLALIVALVVIGILNLRDRLGLKPVPTDGVYWVSTDKGIEAKTIAKDSPLALTLKPGDYLRYIYYNGKYGKVSHPESVSHYLSMIGIGGRARYAVEHNDETLKGIYQLRSLELYDYEFEVQEANQHLGLGLYLALIGVVYLAIGLFVLFKQARARLTYHFLAWFIASFVMYFYQSTKEFTALDKFVDFLDVSGIILLAPLFLHFCARFSFRNGLGPIGKTLSVAMYVPPVVLLTLEVFYHYLPTVFSPGGLVKARDTLDWIEMFQYAGYFVLGSGILVFSFIKAKTPLLRQQLKWIIWGLGLSVPAFVGLYFIPYVSDIEPTPFMKGAACAPLILIPLSFGYSIVRYRLMDVDVIMRRSFVHLVAMTGLGAFYMALLLGVGDLVKFVWPTADMNSWGGTRAIVVAGMLIVAMLFTPIRDKLQVLADRWFYGERYSMRTGIQDFGRMLAQTTALPSLLTSLTRRLADILSVQRVAIFVMDEHAASAFRMAHSLGLDGEIVLPSNIKDLLRTRSLGRGFISHDDLLIAGAAPEDENFGDEEWIESNGVQIPGKPNGTNNKSAAPSDLYYYVPCIVRDRTVAIIGLGRTAAGALLTSEDTDLLRALSGYVAVAIDNSLLHRSEMEKAEELARLKEFSENIIQSVSVGIAVVDLNGRITTWNSAVEEMFGISFKDAVGSDAKHVLDPDLIDAVHKVSGRLDWAVDSPRHLYKCGVRCEDGTELTVNVSVAPFESAPGVLNGTIMVIENVTERMLLEQQLMEREKLSSIGLLAAGVAHEVNTPLAGISSYSQMLLQQVPEEDPRHQLLEKIHAQTVRASGIVNNLLNFSRTGNTKFYEFDLNKVLEDTLQLLDPQLRNSQVQVVRSFGSELPGGWGNGSKLQQVFMNLILNARDAMPAGGKLIIQSRQVESSLVIDFKDTGIGIAPENIARIYDPFFTTKEVGQGTGLGLALSYGIVQEHGGRIFVESRPGEGAHFTIKLPTANSRQMQVASD